MSRSTLPPRILLGNIIHFLKKVQIRFLQILLSNVKLFMYDMPHERYNLGLFLRRANLIFVRDDAHHARRRGRTGAEGADANAALDHVEARSVILFFVYFGFVVIVVVGGFQDGHSGTAANVSSLGSQVRNDGIVIQSRNAQWVEGSAQCHRDAGGNARLFVSHGIHLSLLMIRLLNRIGKEPIDIVPRTPIRPLRRHVGILHKCLFLVVFIVRIIILGQFLFQRRIVFIRKEESNGLFLNVIHVPIAQSIVGIEACPQVDIVLTAIG
mmetsp:Transcript_43128/g.73555  ORF Transcript_43128/g.73555 Transcript_43128/m.73555 type:complete len:268 (-) Transcript_43128:763-1566(-)